MNHSLCTRWIPVNTSMWEVNIQILTINPCLNTWTQEVGVMRWSDNCGQYYHYLDHMTEHWPITAQSHVLWHLQAEARGLVLQHSSFRTNITTDQSQLSVFLMLLTFHQSELSILDICQPGHNEHWTFSNWSCQPLLTNMKHGRDMIWWIETTNIFLWEDCYTWPWPLLLLEIWICVVTWPGALSFNCSNKLSPLLCFNTSTLSYQHYEAKKVLCRRHTSLRLILILSWENRQFYLYKHSTLYLVK